VLNDEELTLPAPHGHGYVETSGERLAPSVAVTLNRRYAIWATAQPFAGSDADPFEDQRRYVLKDRAHSLLDPPR
jgi:hypothetical protein